VGVVGVCVMHLPYSICQRHFEVRNNAANLIWQPALLKQLSKKQSWGKAFGRVSTHVEQFLGSGDWYPLVINLSLPTYPSVLKRIECTHRFSKIKSRFGIHNCDSQKMMKKVRELLGCWNNWN
jgi:glycyl-tRNA synthetase alpha subunit